MWLWVMHFSNSDEIKTVVMEKLQASEELQFGVEEKQGESETFKSYIKNSVVY